jgi:hypothetical protein
MKYMISSPWFLEQFVRSPALGLGRVRDGSLGPERFTRWAGATSRPDFADSHRATGTAPLLSRLRGAPMGFGSQGVCVFMTTNRPLQAKRFYVAQGGAQQVGVEHSAIIDGEFA